MAPLADVQASSIGEPDLDDSHRHGSQGVGLLGRGPGSKIPKDRYYPTMCYVCVASLPLDEILSVSRIACVVGNLGLNTKSSTPRWLPPKLRVRRLGARAMAGAGRDAVASLVMELAKSAPAYQQFATWNDRLYQFICDLKQWCKSKDIRSSTIEELRLAVACILHPWERT